MGENSILQKQIFTESLEGIFSQEKRRIQKFKRYIKKEQTCLLYVRIFACPVMLNHAFLLSTLNGLLGIFRL